MSEKSPVGDQCVDPLVWQDYATIFQTLVELFTVGGLAIALHSRLTTKKGTQRKSFLIKECTEALNHVLQLEATLTEFRTYLRSVHFDVQQRVSIRTSMVMTDLGRFFLFR